MNHSSDSTPIPIRSEGSSIRDSYISGDYFEKNPSFHVEDSPWKAAQIKKMLDRHQLRPRSICEIGCGAGEILNQLHGILPDDTTFSGYELSPQGYELCLTREKPRLRFSQQDLFELAPPVFELMLCIDVFEHIEDCFLFLKNLSTRAEKFIFHIPLDMNVQMVLRAEPILRVRQSVGHLHYFSKDTALATLRDTGYQIDDWFYTPNGLDRPSSVKARLARLPRMLSSRLSQDLTARVLGGYSLLVLASVDGEKARQD